MPATFVYPDSTEIQAIEQDLVAEMEADDPVFFGDLFPVDNDSESYKLEWEQWDNFSGLQQARGLDGQPSPVVRLGTNRFSTEPGVYGEYVRMEESELTRRGAFAKFSGRIDMTDWTAAHQRFLASRRIDRIKYLGWTLLTTGRFLVSSPDGGYEHRDTYALETLTASPAINSLSTGAPFAFLLTWILKGRGTSSKFGPEATCYVNQVTANIILTNANPNDLGGRYRLPSGATVNTLDELNTILTARGCPRLAVYDKGFSTSKNTTGTFTPFIPDGYGVLVGKRTTRTPLGKYRYTVNAHNGFAPGPYIRVVNTFGQEGVSPSDARFEIHDGHNGGPVLQYPSGVKIIRFY